MTDRKGSKGTTNCSFSPSASVAKALDGHRTHRELQILVSNLAVSDSGGRKGEGGGGAEIRSQALAKESSTYMCNSNRKQEQ